MSKISNYSDTDYAWFQEIKKYVKEEQKKLLSPLLFNAEVKLLIW